MEDYERQVRHLRQQRGSLPFSKTGESTAVVGDSISNLGSRNKEKLVTLTLMSKNKNPNTVSKSALKEQMIRNLEKQAQPDGRNQTEREFDEMAKSKDQETKKFVREIFNQRPCTYKKQQFIAAIEKDPSIHPNAATSKSLSPNAKLRMLKAQIESKFKNPVTDKDLTSLNNSIEFLGTLHSQAYNDQRRNKRA